MFREPEKLPSAHEAGLKSLPESSMASRRFELAEKLLRSYCPDKLLTFLFKHGRASTACQLMFPAANANAAVHAVQASTSRYD